MSCALSTGINNLRSAAGIVSNAQTVANHYVVPYTNPQSIQWDADTETFMDVRCPSDSDIPCLGSHVYLLAELALLLRSSAHGQLA